LFYLFENVFYLIYDKIYLHDLSDSSGINRFGIDIFQVLFEIFKTDSIKKSDFKLEIKLD